MTRPGQTLRRPPFDPRIWLLALVPWWIMGCGNPRGAARPDPAARARSLSPLRIAAASDLQAALPRLGERFRIRNGIAITPTFLSSGVLAQQIKQGAPYDVFLAANESFVRGLAGGGFIRPDSVHPYARGSLVLAVFGELGDRVGSLSDLSRPEVKKIALANPETAPYGMAGKQALERAGLWDRLRPKIVVAESVRQALLYAQKGDAEAALVGRAIADLPEVRTVEIDASLYDPIVQALGIVADSPRRADAEAFIQFILGEEGQAVLNEFGFRPATTGGPCGDGGLRTEPTKSAP
jgi:molybdate transport system substrate-binding protein